MEKKKEIVYVCEFCGIKANYLTQRKKYGKDFDEDKFIPSAEGVVTCHQGICDVCGKERLLTNVRNYFYPDFSLIDSKED